MLAFFWGGMVPDGLTVYQGVNAYFWGNLAMRSEFLKGGGGVEAMVGIQRAVTNVTFQGFPCFWHGGLTTPMPMFRNDNIQILKSDYYSL